MSLLALHKVLISFAVAFFLFFGISELTRSGSDHNILIAIICLVLAAGTSVYLVWVLKGGYVWKKKG